MRGFAVEDLRCRMSIAFSFPNTSVNCASHSSDMSIDPSDKQQIDSANEQAEVDIENGHHTPDSETNPEQAAWDPNASENAEMLESEEPGGENDGAPVEAEEQAWSEGELPGEEGAQPAGEWQSPEAADASAVPVAIPEPEPHMQQCASCGSLVNVTEVEPLMDAVCPACGSINQVEGRLGNYMLAAIAGRGGMGVVYKAWDASLGRWVAIKLLRRDQSKDLLTIKRLEAEAGLTATVNHPNVVRVFSTGRDRDRFYIVMELVDQGSLDDLIRLQGRVGEVQVIDIGIQAAKGLNAAQNAGLIHRDVKPGNILFSDDRTAKIVDFGLAIFQEEEESSRGEVWGTPYYVAPEKLDSLPEDFRSDMYSLGGTLFHALAGRPPFEAEDASHVALKHLKSQSVSIQAFAPWVSNSTAFIINRTLAKDPDARFQSYEELVENLEYAKEALLNKIETPQTKSRVVMEDDKEQQAWGWVTLAALGVAVVGIILLAVFWKQIFGGNKEEGPAVAAASVSADSPLSGVGVELLSGGRYADATKAFRAASADDKKSATDRTWNRLALVLSLKLEGNQTVAGEIQSELLRNSEKTQPVELASFFKEMAARMARNTAIEPTELSGLSRTNYQSIGLLAYGVHNLSLGKNSEGVRILREFRSINPASPYGWLTQLKTSATNIIDQAVAVDMLESKFAAEKISSKRMQIAFELSEQPRIFARRIDAIVSPIRGEMEKTLAKILMPPTAGAYRTINRLTSKHLDAATSENRNGGKVIQSDPNGGLQQKWDFAPQKDGMFKLINRNNNRAMAVRKGATSGQLVEQIDQKDAPEQLWKIENVQREWFRIVSVANGMSLSLKSSDTNNSEVTVESAKADAKHAQWRFVKSEMEFAPWKYTEIGYAAGEPLVESPSSGVIAITAGGSDIWDKADHFRFLWQTVSGDFDFTAKLVSMTRVSDWTKAGIMIRQALRDVEPHVGAIIAHDHGMNLTFRTTTAALSGAIRKGDVKAPTWLRLERRGTTIHVLHSSDGKSWTKDTTQKIDKLPGNVYVGLVACSRDNNASTTAVFSDINIKRLDGQPQAAPSQPTASSSPTPAPASGSATSTTAKKPLFSGPVLSGSTLPRLQTVDVALKDSKQLYLVVTDEGSSRHDWADWIEPKLVFADGTEKDLTTLKWKESTNSHGQATVGKAYNGKPMTVEKKTYSMGIGTHASSMIGFDLPPNVVKFRSKTALDDGGIPTGDSGSIRFHVYGEKPDLDFAKPKVGAIQHGDFESQKDGPIQAPWMVDQRAKFNALVESAQQHGGSKSVWLEVPQSEQWTSLNQNVKVEKNAKYVLSAWCRSSDSMFGKNFALGVRDVGTDKNKSESNVKLTGEWTRIEHRFEARDRSELNIFGAFQGLTSANGWIRVDDFEMKKQ